MCAWINAELEQPNDDRRVLVVKERKDGKRDIGIGYFSEPFRDKYNGGWVLSGSCKVVYWMELPNIPKE